MFEQKLFQNSIQTKSLENLISQVFYQMLLIKSIPELSGFITVFTRNKLCSNFKILAIRCEFTVITAIIVCTGILNHL